MLILALAAARRCAIAARRSTTRSTARAATAPTATGTPGSVPALRDSVARFLAVPGGRDYLARVPGVAQAPLDDAALAAVLNWMLDHFDAAHVPAGFAPYTATEVGPLRAHPLVDVEGTRKQLLDRIAPATPGQ